MAGKGTAGEQKLARRLNDEGWAVIRSAGSGTAERASCDLVAINDSAILFIECKTYEVATDPIQVHDDMRQLDVLVDRADRGENLRPRRTVKPVLAIKQDGSMMWKYTADTGKNTIVPDSIDNKLYELLKRYNP